MQAHPLRSQREIYSLLSVLKAFSRVHELLANKYRHTHRRADRHIHLEVETHLPSLYGTTSGFFSSYISSEWLNGNEILSFICRFPGRENFAFECWNFSCCGCLCERNLSAAIVPMPMHTSATRMPTKMPIESIGVSSKLFEP